MNMMAMMALAAMTFFTAFAQEKPKSAERPQRSRMVQRPMMQGQGPWLVRLFTKKENFEKIGISDKIKADKLFADLESIKGESNALEKKIREISREQAELMRKLFSDRTSDGKDVMAKIDEVAKLRADQARLSVKAIQLLRENLSDEQMQNARNMIMERGRMRRAMRHGGGAQAERHRQPRGKGQRQAPLNSEAKE